MDFKIKSGPGVTRHFAFEATSKVWNFGFMWLCHEYEIYEKTAISLEEHYERPIGVTLDVYREGEYMVFDYKRKEEANDK